MAQEVTITYMILFAYLIGSLSSAVIVCKLFKLPDPRTEGSKSAGATNVLRLGGKKTAAIVMVCDILKGLLPTLYAVFIGLPYLALPYVALAAVIGHVYPIFYRFHGGKGVATMLGGVYAINILLGMTVTAIWLIVAKIWRYSSLASLWAVILAPLFALILLPTVDYFLPIFLMAMLVTFKHRANIRRLWKRTEPKIKLSKGGIVQSMAVDPDDECEDYYDLVLQDMEDKKNEIMEEIEDFKIKTLQEIEKKARASLKKAKAKPAAKRKKPASKKSKPATTKEEASPQGDKSSDSTANQASDDQR